MFARKRLSSFLIDTVSGPLYNGHNYITRPCATQPHLYQQYRLAAAENLTRFPPPFFVPMETKTIPQFTKEINGRTVTGIFAVNGNVDSGGDVSVNGAFAKRLADGSRKRARHLWNHNSMNPPTASIRELREVGRDELPEKVLAYAPDATGGVLVTREYYEGVELANWVLAGIKAGDITEMSYAYDLHDWDYEDRGGMKVRVLKDIEIFDTSDVNWGMNPATAAVKGIAGDGLTFMQHGEAVETALADYLERIKDRRDFRAKEGRVLSSANRERIKALVASLHGVAGDLEQLLLETEPKADPALVLQALANYQATIAKLNGVKLS